MNQYREITNCSWCATKVIPNSDMTCPSCGHQVAEFNPLSSPAHRPVQGAIDPPLGSLLPSSAKATTYPSSRPLNTVFRYVLMVAVILFVLGYTIKVLLSLLPFVLMMLGYGFNGGRG